MFSPHVQQWWTCFELFFFDRLHVDWARFLHKKPCCETVFWQRTVFRTQLIACPVHVFCHGTREQKHGFRLCTSWSEHGFKALCPFFSLAILLGLCWPPCPPLPPNGRANPFRHFNSHIVRTTDGWQSSRQGRGRLLCSLVFDLFGWHKMPSHHPGPMGLTWTGKKHGICICTRSHERKAPWADFHSVIPRTIEKMSSCWV